MAGDVPKPVKYREKAVIWINPWTQSSTDVSADEPIVRQIARLQPRHSDIIGACRKPHCFGGCGCENCLDNAASACRSLSADLGSGPIKLLAG